MVLLLEDLTEPSKWIKTNQTNKKILKKIFKKLTTTDDQ